MLKSIGLDIGGTNISAVVCDELGNIVHSFTRRSDFYGDQYLKNIEDIISILLNENRDITGIGIGVPGTVEHETGRVAVCPAFGWEDVRLKEHIENMFGIRTEIDNDVNAWTLAEKYLGAAKGLSDFAMITIGTGIGCGLCIGGKIYRGHSYEAGEIGYLPLGTDAYSETIHNNEFGYFESKASALAASNTYRKLTGKYLDCRKLFEMADQGDESAKMIVDDVYRYLGLGISSIICVLNPQAVIIGGGMAKEGQRFLDEVTKRVHQLIPLKVHLGLTKTGNYGGAVGSALGVFFYNNSKETVQTN
jgi:glucokinase